MVMRRTKRKNNILKASRDTWTGEPTYFLSLFDTKTQTLVVRKNISESKIRNMLNDTNKKR